MEQATQTPWRRDRSDELQLSRIDLQVGDKTDSDAVVESEYGSPCRDCRSDNQSAFK